MDYVEKKITFFLSRPGNYTEVALFRHCNVG
jgi:hypothetical protein